MSGRLEGKMDPRLKATLVELKENFTEKLMILMIERLGGSISFTEADIDIDHAADRVMIIEHKNHVFHIELEKKP